MLNKRKIIFIVFLISMIIGFCETEITFAYSNETLSVEENVNEYAANEEENEIFNLINTNRTNLGMDSLVLDEKLCRMAEMKAEDMRDKRYFSHYSPTYGFAYDMLKGAGYQYKAVGENIAKGHRSPQIVMSAWMKSPGHKANILGNYTKVGVGFVTDEKGKTYWVQIFAK